ncbi:MAG: hypothetical protein H6745_16140 [Deltaproteobacteria bacterium]|nr:hypothetical protein [Deltaproteobacteria bacterium]
MSETHAHDQHHHAAPSAGVNEAPIGPRRLVSEMTPGGHEIDRTPNFVLFGFLVLTAVVLVASAIGVYQLFVHETDKEQKAAADRPVPMQVEQAKRDADYYDNYGVVPPQKEGEQATLRMPITVAEKLVLEHPDRFAAAAPPAGWVHPDDAVPAPAPAPGNP